MDAAKANTEIAVQFGLIAPEQLRNLSWVEFDLEEPDSMAAAIGNASRVSGLQLQGMCRKALDRLNSLLAYQTLLDVRYA